MGIGRKYLASIDGPRAIPNVEEEGTADDETLQAFRRCQCKEDLNLPAAVIGVASVLAAYSHIGEPHKLLSAMCVPCMPTSIDAKNKTADSASGQHVGDPFECWDLSPVAEESVPRLHDALLCNQHWFDWGLVSPLYEDIPQQTGNTKRQRTARVMFRADNLGGTDQNDE